MNPAIALIAVAAAVAVPVAAPAVAETVETVRVPTHDLDLATPAGQRILDLRIARAASSLCADPNARFSSQLRIAQNACRAAAVAAARTAHDRAIRLTTR